MTKTAPGRWSLDYVRTTYGVPAKRGMRVIADGKPGVITCGDGQYLRVRLDGEKHSGRWHPTWEMVYLPAGASSAAGSGGPTTGDALPAPPHRDTHE